MTTGIAVDIQWVQGNQAGQACFTLKPGVTALIGPSGAGKTTLAKVLAGLHSACKGTISADGVPLSASSDGIHIAPRHRRAGYVPQDSALFPHMTVRENIHFGLRATNEILDRLIEVAGIASLMDRHPHTLSGGEARRVAIVRALAADPAFLILDEPMNGLDAGRRREIIDLIRKTARASALPVLMITHQIDDMLQAADSAVLMEEGQQLVAGTIDDVLAHPRASDILQFDDAGTLLEATVNDRLDGLIASDIGGATLFLPDDDETIGARLRLRILARDVAISLGEPKGISIVNRLPCTIANIRKHRSGFELALALQDSDVRLLSRVTEKSCTDLKLEEGQTVFALVKAVAVKELLADTR